MATGIEWTDETWNPVTGCTNISPGCDHCYAETITNRFKRHPWEQVTLHEDRLIQPEKWKKPRKVFLCSMGDLFHSDVPFYFIEQVFITMVNCQQHAFQVLTKRPGRMEWWINNRWLPKWGGGFQPASTEHLGRDFRGDPKVCASSGLFGQDPGKGPVRILRACPRASGLLALAQRELC